MKVPTYYMNNHWSDSAGQKPLMYRLSSRIDEIERRLPNMSLKERQDLWQSEPYWEISKLIIESKDWVFPK